MNKKKIWLISSGLVVALGLGAGTVYALNQPSAPPISSEQKLIPDPIDPSFPQSDSEDLIVLQEELLQSGFLTVEQPSLEGGTLSITLSVDSELTLEQLQLIASKTLLLHDVSELLLIVHNKNGDVLDLTKIIEPIIGGEGWKTYDGKTSILSETMRIIIDYKVPGEPETPADPSTPETETPTKPETGTPAQPKPEAPTVPAPAPAPPVIQPPAPPAPAPVVTSTAEESDMLARVNAKRAASGLGALTLNSKLTAAAVLQAEYQATNKMMTHDGNGGLGARISSKGYNWCAAAENVAMGYGSTEAVFNGWVNSSGHLANILSPNITEMGLALSKDSNGTPYWAQVFGKSC